tara:strand:+ start:142 stop:336 length:195 start_codon:yes stop_codon:yes gene_type:complete
MIVQPLHNVSENCYRIYIIHKGLRQQVGEDFHYTDKDKQEKAWLRCLRFAREIEDQIEHDKDKN